MYLCMLFYYCNAIIPMLPLELWLIVFSFLNGTKTLTHDVPQVCRGWATICLSFMDINLDVWKCAERYRLTANAMRSVAARFLSVNVFNYRDLVAITSPKLEQLLKTYNPRTLIIEDDVLLPGLAQTCPLLERLVIYNTVLMTLPAEINQLIALQILDLGGCYELKSLPKINQLTSLQTLNLNRCYQLVSLPEINQLTALQTLDLSHCHQLVSLPEMHLSALQTLDLSNCVRLVSFPAIKLANNQFITPQPLDLSDCHDLWISVTARN